MGGRALATMLGVVERDVARRQADRRDAVRRLRAIVRAASNAVLLDRRIQETLANGADSASRRSSRPRRDVTDKDLDSSRTRMSVDANAIKACAARLRQAAEAAVAIAPIRDELARRRRRRPPMRVQQANTDHYLKQGRRLVGPQDRPHVQVGAEAARRRFARFRHAVRRHGALRRRGSRRWARCCSPRSRRRSRSCSSATSTHAGRDARRT